MRHRIASVSDTALPIIHGMFQGADILKHENVKKFSAADRVYVGLVKKDFSGKLFDIFHATLPSGKRLTCIGLGDKKTWNHRNLIKTICKVISSVKVSRVKSVSIWIADFSLSFSGHSSIPSLLESIAQSVERAAYDFKQYKEKPKETVQELEEVVYAGCTPGARAGGIRALEHGRIIGEQVNFARHLGNVPGGEMTPKVLARHAQQEGKKHGFSVTAFGEAHMKKLNMGAILGVSQGSSEEAQFVVMEWYGAARSKKPLVFIGKGITFDSGGLNLKPGMHMDEMHMDMVGAAAVIATLGACARMKIRENVVGIFPAVENMPSGQSYRPGDILRSMSGKTIEVANTDAEGRVVLSDALTYAQKFNPRCVVDVATLTGAVVVALGHQASAILSKNDNFRNTLCELGEVSGDYLWPLPLWDEYEDDIRGDIGDVLNSSKTREAGTINGAMFLYQFAKQFPLWAHIDIASTMTTHRDQFLSKGASGTGTRLLIEIARQAAFRKI